MPTRLRFFVKYGKDSPDGSLLDALPDCVIEHILVYAGLDYMNTKLVCKRWYKALSSCQDIYERWLERTSWSYIRDKVVDAQGIKKGRTRDHRDLFHCMHKSEAKCKRWEASERVILTDPHLYPLSICYDERRLLTMGRDAHARGTLKLWDMNGETPLSISFSHVHGLELIFMVVLCAYKKPTEEREWVAASNVTCCLPLHRDAFSFWCCCSTHGT